MAGYNHFEGDLSEWFRLWKKQFNNLDSQREYYEKLAGDFNKMSDEEKEIFKGQWFSDKDPVPPPTTIFYTGLPHKFLITRLKKDLKFEQRVIAFRFRAQLDLAADISEEPIF